MTSLGGDNALSRVPSRYCIYTYGMNCTVLQKAAVRTKF